MENKEKAIELVYKFAELTNDSVITNLAKQSAILLVDEMIKITAPFCDRYEQYYQMLNDEQTANYWLEVKSEIECFSA